MSTWPGVSTWPGILRQHLRGPHQSADRWVNQEYTYTEYDLARRGVERMTGARGERARYWIERAKDYLRYRNISRLLYEDETLDDSDAEDGHRVWRLIREEVGRYPRRASEPPPDPGQGPDPDLVFQPVAHLFPSGFWARTKTMLDPDTRVKMEPEERPTRPVMPP